MFSHWLAVLLVRSESALERARQHATEDDEVDGPRRSAWYSDRPPPFFAAVVSDTRRTMTARQQHDVECSDVDVLRQTPRLMWETDGLLGLVAYRAQSRWTSLGIPVLPRLARRVCSMAGNIRIDDQAIIEPGAIFPHGQVTITGATHIGPGSSIRQWTRIGPGPTGDAPQLGAVVRVGTTSEISGSVRVGAHAIIGANACVSEDVPAKATVVGDPARVIGMRTPAPLGTPRRAARPRQQRQPDRSAPPVPT